mmetsp:Transcript_17193/g.36983  ORF Transcript_17193/g.36983 Transcript_17193/m.36983 type:complete len:181 (-) Transcript_17193:106-648(-)
MTVAMMTSPTALSALADNIMCKGQQVRLRAGGVVFRRCSHSGAQQVLLVSSRSPDKKGYSFPAGKFEGHLDGGMEACALRETQEEAGAECAIVSDLGWFRGVAKKDSVETRTRFFAMRCDRELEHWPEESERSRRWVNLSEAKEWTTQSSVTTSLLETLEELTRSDLLAAALAEANPQES